MLIEYITKADFFIYAHKCKHELMRRLGRYEALIVKEYLEPDTALKLRKKSFQWGISSEASWHPLENGCPDYHRLHDNYPKAWVKQKFHGFYYHGWYQKNDDIFSHFFDLFNLKNVLSDKPEAAHTNNIPSDHIVARVNLHHYPRGGGYQAEHIDPAGPFAKIQTLIMGSQYGTDYNAGGLYVRNPETNDRFFLDKYAKLGDMVVISPAIVHGVAEIDPHIDYDWKNESGRWLILPLFLFSDYPHEMNIKPMQVSTGNDNLKIKGEQS